MWKAWAVECYETGRITRTFNIGLSFYFPLSVFEKLRNWTDVYAYSQSLRAIRVNNRDGRPIKKEMQVQEPALKKKISISKCF